MSKRKTTDRTSSQSEHSGRTLKRRAEIMLSEEPAEKETTTEDTGLEAESGYGHFVFWEDYFGQWPPKAVEPRTMDELQRKRPHTPSQLSSFSQFMRDGGAWTFRHEIKMEEVGLIMDPSGRPQITDGCKQLCEQLLSATYTLPNDPALRPERFAKVLRGVRSHNRTRLARGVLPVLVPSAELLHIEGHACLDGIIEETNEEWVDCVTFCGPRPKPDRVVGIAASALTEEERSILRSIHTSASPNLFPEYLYLPFLVCEVGASHLSIQGAERRAMHSASIAAHAIIQLHRRASVVDEVDQRLLVFSVACSESSLKIHGHYAKIDSEKTTYFRHQLYSSDFDVSISSGTWSEPYQIARAIYDRFFPQHLDRIKRVLSRFTLVSDTSQHSSFQEGGSLPSTSQQQQENDRLRDLLVWHEEEMAKRQAQHEEEMAKRRAQHEEEMAKRRAQHVEEMAKRRTKHEELMEKLQAEQMEKLQAEQMEELQAEQMEKLQTQHKELMEKHNEQVEKLWAQFKEYLELRKEQVKKQLPEQQDVFDLLTELIDQSPSNNFKGSGQ